jgi:UPF0755 protein
MKAVKKTAGGSIALLLLLAALGITSWSSWRWWIWASAAPTATLQSASNFQVADGTSAQEIGKALEARGLIRSAQAWNLWARWLQFKQPGGGFQAGVYRLSPGQEMPAIATKIWTGDVVQNRFTIPEGWSIKQMATYFEQQKFFPAQTFLKAVEDFPVARYSWLPLDRPVGTNRLEGFLYPDTYQFNGVPDPSSVLKQMLDRFEQVALSIYQQGRDKTSLSFSDWVTLASIVEKEAVIPEERPLIAGVFLNRLKKGMPLGADPTVEYGLGIRQTPDRPLTLKEVRTQSPYNTYLNPGLPPTPIANPGLASLKATLYPKNTDYLYFVARYDGTHVFSRTLQEHQVAQAQIQDNRKTATPTRKK